MGYDYTSINFNGLLYEKTNYNKLKVKKGSCVSDTKDIINIKLNSDIEFIINDKLDVGSIQPDTFYYLFIVKHKNTLKVDVVVSANKSNPDISLEYYKRFIGVFRTDGVGDIIDFGLIPFENGRRYIYANDRSDRRVLYSGTASSYTDVDCSLFVPEIAMTILLELTNSNSGTVYITDNSWNNYDLFRAYGRDTITITLKNYYQDIKYRVTGNGRADISIYGFDFEV